MASSTSHNTPCAACKFLRKKCLQECIFAPHFPPEDPQKFVNIHKIFGTSNVSKLLNELLPHQRDDAVTSLAYEAEARIRDPVYGCVAAISFLQTQVEMLHKELHATKAELIRYAYNDLESRSIPPSVHQQMMIHERLMGGRRREGNSIPFSCPLPWNNSNNSFGGGGGNGTARN